MIVIADDITGAAEIAGIAFTQGQQVRLVCDAVCGGDIAADMTTVIATDTRSMSEAEAANETRRILVSLSLEGNEERSLFKKTDSALRGHVVAELKALMEATGYQRAVYLPANPSKGRIIRKGVYYIREAKDKQSPIADVPIHETAFSYDPEFPARTAFVKERFPDAEANHIIMPDAESEEDICRVITQYDDGKTVFAGAADLFAALMKVKHNTNSTHASSTTPVSPYATLILCGSTQSKALDIGIPVSPMPLAIYDGSNDLSLWNTDAYAHNHSLMLTMPFTHRTGKEAAVHLRTVMAEKAKRLIAEHCPEHLVIEGGATAWATLQTLGWRQFEIVGQIAPGVVQMRADNGTVITLKPGSYPWGGLL